MQTRWLTLGCLVIALGCARGALIPPARATDPGARSVQGMWYPRLGQWQRSKWYRALQDVTNPFRVLISVDNYACIMDGIIDDPLPNTYYVCASGWRYPSNRNR